MSRILEPVDWLTIKKSLADLSEDQKTKARNAEKLAKLEDKGINIHKDYWLSLQARHLEMSSIYDKLRESLE